MIDSFAPAHSPLPGLSPVAKFLSRLPKPLKSIALSIAPSDSVEVRRYGVIGGWHEDVLKFVQKRQGAHPEDTLKFCDEAGPRGDRGRRAQTGAYNMGDGGQRTTL